ncbi:hypothetical protein [Thermococcus profundus]|uniref:hypothetical protein n=1 Tax=Thermococcus profundus TaxID=49899 RepID=UPI000B5A0851|nr:hypothetical protein [Thermococcus profundus]
MGNLKALSKAYAVARGDRKLELARELVRVASKHSLAEPFWEKVRELGLKPGFVKDALHLLEEKGEVRIKRSVDGRNLYVLTLREIRRNPVRLDRWINLRSSSGGRTDARPRRRGR